MNVFCKWFRGSHIRPNEFASVRNGTWSFSLSKAIGKCVDSNYNKLYDRLVSSEQCSSVRAVPLLTDVSVTSFFFFAICVFVVLMFFPYSSPAAVCLKC